MWLLFHQSKRTRAVAGGEQFVDTCPSCQQRATFVEVELEENVGLFFVDMIGDKQRAFRCSSCLDTFERKDDGDAAGTEVDEALPAAPPKRVDAPRTPLDRRRLRARVIAEEIEAELLAIKSRLGH